MHIVDIRDAIYDNDTAAMRIAFRAFTGPSDDERVVGADERGRASTFRALCEKLRRDGETMPQSTCAALELAPGTTYAAGSAKALGIDTGAWSG